MMVNYEYQELFLKDSIDKQIHIVSDEYTIFENGMKKPLIDITNKELHQEKFELTESLCSENELTFGSCEASMIKFTVSNIFLPMKDKWLTVTIEVKIGTDIYTGIDIYETFQIGRYKVYSDELSADHMYRDITAYDAMYDIINSDVIDWYNSVFPLAQEKTIQTVTMRQFRKSFIEHFGLEESEMDELINDNMTVEKTIEVENREEENSGTESKSVLKESSLSGAAVIQAICEINGCFGHIGRDGKFHYIYLKQDIQGLYPSNELFPDHAPDYLPQSKTGHLYPQSPKSTNIGKSFYITANYEDYRVRGIDKLQIRKEENDIGSIVGEGENCYIIEDNFLVYGKNAAELEMICTNIYNKIKNIIYRPFSADCKGNPCLEVGDGIRMSTKYDLIETYILERTLKGIQSLRDTFSAKGEECRTENVNSVNKSIIQLKGKTNTLIRNVDETNSHIDDVERGLSSEIKQTAEQIKSTVAKENTKWDTIGYTIEISSYGKPNNIVDEAGSLTYQPQKYRNKYYLDQETGYLYQSNGTSWIKHEELQKTAETLKTSIEQTANSITSTVAAATSKYDIGKRRVDYYGYGEPKEDLNNAPDNSRYLDQSSGDYYIKWSHNGWRKEETLELITNEIKASLSLKVDKDGENGVVSVINGSADKIHFNANNMFTVDSPNFKIKENGNVTITGNIEAKGGKIGHFLLNEVGYMEYDTKINNEVCGLGAGAAFYAGDREDSLKAPFHVTYDGLLYAKGGQIGNFTINKEQGWMEYDKKESNKVCGLGANEAFYAGSDKSSEAPFHVTYNGLLYAKGGQIGNFEINEEQGWMQYDTKINNAVCGLGARAAFYAGDRDDSLKAPFHVTYDGHLHAESANISGIINAEEGKIGHFLLSKDGAMKYSNDNGICGMGANQAFYAGSGDSDNAPFRVSYEGVLHATNANISGTINASGGTIAGWNIGSNGLNYSEGNDKSIMSSEKIELVRYPSSNYIIAIMRAGEIILDSGKTGTIRLGSTTFTHEDFEKLYEMIHGT